MIIEYHTHRGGDNGTVSIPKRAKARHRGHALRRPSHRTEQRRAIRSAIEQAQGPLRAAEVLEVARQQVPGLGIATVYRNLRTLLETGLLTVVELPGEPNRYEIAGKKHHHHFRCDACRRVLDIAGCSRSIDHAAPRRFEVEGHELVLFGRCPDCRVS